MLEVAYAGSKNLTSWPGQPLTGMRCAPNFFALGDDLRTQVPNPFFGKIRAASAAANVERQLLLRAYPQFVSIRSAGDPRLPATTHSFLLSVQKRFTSGFSISGAYTLSKLMDNAPGNGEAGGSIQNVYKPCRRKVGSVAK
jgi:hypothetical protein